MKKLKRAWLNIPRKVRVGINLLATILLIFALYILLECPAFTQEQKFRRTEKAEMVGPSHILASLDLSELGYSHVILAETADAVILFQADDNPWNPGQLFYREKTGTATVMTVPRLRYWRDDEIVDLPVFVFHDCPQAVRAELDLEFGEGMRWYTEVNWNHNGTTTTTNYDKTWYLESDQELGGYFRFDIHAEPEVEIIEESPFQSVVPRTSEGTAMQVFSAMMEKGDSYIYAAIPAAVRFYDADGDLIREEQITIRSVTGERYAQEGGTAP